jgi:transcriptional regulator of acetoin/glycerol metabolism
LLSLFSNSRNDRVAQAKAKYFEDGVLPTGTVSDHIFQSWMRCYRGSARTTDRIEFQPVSASRSQLSIQKNRALHEAWVGEQANLLPVVSSSSCSVVLTDPTGVLIGLTPSTNPDQKIIPVAHRVGISLAEEFVGTTAPGLVARTGAQACVLGSEHYFDSVKDMFCAAAPIRGIDGKLAGILDISSEIAPFAFEPSSVVGAYASSIENRLLISQARNSMLVKFQFLPGLMDSPMVGMLGIDFDGCLEWVNSVTNNLLKIPFECRTEKLRTEDVFELSLNRLLALIDKGTTIQRLTNGFSVYLSVTLCEKSAVVTNKISSAVVMDPSDSHDCAPSQLNTSLSNQESIELEIPHVESFQDADSELIKKYLSEYKGNISKVAKKLKVSRGLIYRRINELAINTTSFKSSR